jgi:hypothetical protein
MSFSGARPGLLAAPLSASAESCANSFRKSHPQFRTGTVNRCCGAGFETRLSKVRSPSPRLARRCCSNAIVARSSTPATNFTTLSNEICCSGYDLGRVWRVQIGIAILCQRAVQKFSARMIEGAMVRS